VSAHASYVLENLIWAATVLGIVIAVCVALVKYDQ
jgi:hypothetical protein